GARGEYLPSEIQMTQIGARVISAWAAFAGWIQRTPISGVRGLLDRNASFAGKSQTITRVSGGQHAVEHVEAHRDSSKQVRWRANPHQIPGFFRGEHRCR